jgi:hypothetical protein
MGKRRVAPNLNEFKLRAVGNGKCRVDRRESRTLNVPFKLNDP